jgi:hypothetical protein
VRNDGGEKSFGVQSDASQRACSGKSYNKSHDHYGYGMRVNESTQILHDGNTRENGVQEETQKDT